MKPEDLLYLRDKAKQYSNKAEYPHGSLEEHTSRMLQALLDEVDRLTLNDLDRKLVHFALDEFKINLGELACAGVLDDQGFTEPITEEQIEQLKKRICHE